MVQNNVVAAIVVASVVIALAIYLRPTEFASCMSAYAAEGIRAQVAADFCSR